MDSNLRKKTIAWMSAFVILLVLIVLILNRDILSEDGGKSAASPAASSMPTGTAIAADGRIEGSDLKAFTRKQDFFDEEDALYSSTEALSQETLSLLVTSAERDIRVRVVDSDGALKKDLNVVVTVEGVGEYKDLDRDGILLITGVDPGNYYVSLEPPEGYRTNARFVSVKVPSVIEYKKLPDIEDIMFMETDLVRVQSDGRQNLEFSADTDLDTKPFRVGIENARSGVRLSSRDPKVDFRVLKQAGAEFVILRAGYRGYSNGVLYQDSSFLARAEDAVAAGLKVGVVFESQAIDRVEAVEEASLVLSVIEDLDITYPVFLDVEPAGGGGRADELTMQERTEVCEAFLKTIRNEGYSAGVEGSRTSLSERVAIEALAAYNLCIDDYSDTETYAGSDYQFWQYTAMGNIGGQSGLFDLVESYLGY